MYDMSASKSNIFLAFESPSHIDRSLEYGIQQVTMENQSQVEVVEAQHKNYDHAMKL